MIRVLIVDPVRLMSNVLARVLKSEADIAVVGSATTTQEVMARACEAEVALINSSFPDQVALNMTRELTRSFPPVKIIVMGLVESEPAILRFIEAGAAGYVLQKDSVDELLRTIRAAHGNQALIPPTLAARLMNRVAELAHISRSSRPPASMAHDMPLPGLTRREREVLGLIAEGYGNQEIARHLAIEVGTAKNHVHNILDKLNVPNRQHAAAFVSLFDEKESRAYARQDPVHRITSGAQINFDRRSRDGTWDEYARQ